MARLVLAAAVVALAAYWVVVTARNCAAVHCWTSEMAAYPQACTDYR